MFNTKPNEGVETETEAEEKKKKTSIASGTMTSVQDRPPEVSSLSGGTAKLAVT
jgi:hypothetical protein